MSTVQPPAVRFTSPRSPRFTTIPAGRNRHIVMDSATGERWGAHPAKAAADLCQRLEIVVPKFDEPCFQCGARCPSDFNADPHLCPDCQRMHADSALAELQGHAQRLIAGEAPFDVLSPAERLEQLTALLGDDYGLLPVDLLINIAGKAAEEIARRMHSIPETAPAKSAVRSYSITELMAEEPYLVGGTVSPEERDECESRVEVDFDRDVPPDAILNMPPVNSYFRDLDAACGIDPRPAA